MRLHKIRGGNEKDLINKQYTIGIGISLGNKWFTVNNIVESVKWSLIYSKDKVIVYVADSIHAINIEVRDKISFERALKKVNKKGDVILKDVKEVLRQQLPEEDFDRVIYVKWQEIVDTSYKSKLDYLYALYAENEEFRSSIHSLITDYTSKENREFSESDVHRLGDYLIEELPEVINRLEMAGVVCDAYLYPYDGKIPEFIEKLQASKIFPEIKKNVMDTEPKVFMEVR